MKKYKIFNKIIALFILTLSVVIIYFSWQNRPVIFEEDIEVRNYMNALSQNYINEDFKLNKEASIENEYYKISFETENEEIVFLNKKTGKTLNIQNYIPLINISMTEDENFCENFKLFNLFNPFYERFLFPFEIIKKDEKNFLIIYRTAKHDVYPFIMLTKESYNQIYKDFSEVQTKENILGHLQTMYVFCPPGSWNLEIESRIRPLFPKSVTMDVYFKRTLSTREPPIRDLIIKYSSVSPQKLRKDYIKAGRVGNYAKFIIFPLYVSLKEDKITITLDTKGICLSKFTDYISMDDLNKVKYNIAFDFENIEFLIK